jgi:hypothetical protein
MHHFDALRNKVSVLSVSRIWKTCEEKKTSSPECNLSLPGRFSCGNGINRVRLNAYVTKSVHRFCFSPPSLALSHLNSCLDTVYQSTARYSSLAVVCPIHPSNLLSTSSSYSSHSPHANSCPRLIPRDNLRTPAEYVRIPEERRPRRSSSVALSMIFRRG